MWVVSEKKESRIFEEVGAEIKLPTRRLSVLAS